MVRYAGLHDYWGYIAFALLLLLIHEFCRSISGAVAVAVVAAQAIAM